MYALVEYSGKQFILREGEDIKIPFLDKKVGSKVHFENVLLYNDGKNETLGNPYIQSLILDGKITSHGKDKKVVVFKKKRRKGYQKKNGHKQLFTLVKIEKLSKKSISKTSSKTTTAKKTTKKTTTKKTTTKKVTKKK